MLRAKRRRNATALLLDTVDRKHTNNVSAKEELADQCNNGGGFAVFDVFGQREYGNHVAQKQGHAIQKHQKQNKRKRHINHHEHDAPEKENQNVCGDMHNFYAQGVLKDFIGLGSSGQNHIHNVANWGECQTRKAADTQYYGHGITTEPAPDKTIG